MNRQNKSSFKLPYFLLTGGEGGIRTRDTELPYTRFPGVLLQPLGHLTALNSPLSWLFGTVLIIRKN